MWRLVSWTYIFNVALAVLGVLLIKDAATKAIVLPILLANIGLREKTNRKIQ